MSEPWPCENEPPYRESWLDAELRRVTPPRGLMARLRAIPGDAALVSIRNDDALDAMLRDVPLPAGLVQRLLQIGAGDGDRCKRRSRMEERAAAASLVVMSWCSYAAALVLFWLADYPFAHAAASTWLQTTSTTEEHRELAPIEAMTLVDAPVPDAPVLDAPPFWPEEGPADRREETLRSMFANAPGLPEEQLLAFCSPDDLSAALDVQATASHDVAGAEVPEEPGFDRSFLSRTGVFPRVDPRRHPVSRAPLTTETASYDLARQSLAEGQLPNPDEIRTEEFLAAVDFGLPRPEQRGLALFVAGCRSPWRISPLAGASENSWLLHIAVTASEVAGADEAARELDPTEIAAADVRLSVRFNVEAVRSYRLYGHEPTRLEGAKLESTRELLSGQATSVVYELQFGSPSEAEAALVTAEAALVTVEWRDPEVSAVRRLSRSIRRRDFAGELSDASAAQRLAALAVAAAEELRQSPFAESIDPAEMLGLARHAAAGEKRPGEFQKFVEIFGPLLAAQSRSQPQARKPAGAQESRSP